MISCKKLGKVAIFKYIIRIIGPKLVKTRDFHGSGNPLLASYLGPQRNEYQAQRRRLARIGEGKKDYRALEHTKRYLGSAKISWTRPRGGHGAWAARARRA